MKHSKAWYRSLLLAAGAMCALPALAQRDVRDDASGFYAGASAGLNSDDESAWRLLGGYSVNRNFGVELGYHDTGESNIGGTGVDTNLWELVGIGRLPLDPRFSLYGKLGGYRGKVKGGGMSETNNDLTFGAGVQYDLSRQVALRGEWQRYADMGGGPFNATSDLDVYSVGVLYRFR